MLGGGGGLTLRDFAYMTLMSFLWAFALQCGHRPPCPFNHVPMQLYVCTESVY